MNSDSANECGKLYVSGIDWMISFMNWRSRGVPEKGNHFSVVVTLPESFSFARMREFISADRRLLSFAGGRLKRPFPKSWLPQWQWRCGDNGVVFGGDLSGAAPVMPDDLLSEPLPAGCSLRIWYCGVDCKGKQQVVFTFSHQIFDGIGAEKFIRDALQMQKPLLPDVDALALPETDWQQVRSAGVRMREYMESMRGCRISRLPQGGRGCPNSFTRLYLEAEKFAKLEKQVETLYGPFTFSLWLLSIILAAVERALSALQIPGEYFMIPMSVDMRNRQIRRDLRYFNQWSMMPLLIQRNRVHESTDAVIRMLRELYMSSLSARTPEMFYTAAQAMRFVPRRGIDLMVARMPAKTLGTLMFSFLNSLADGENGSEAMMPEELYHCPVMPRGSTLGFFANVYRGSLSLVISGRHDLPSEAMDGVIAEIRRKIEETSRNE